jgi:hypothetical protein
MEIKLHYFFTWELDGSYLQASAVLPQSKKLGCHRAGGDIDPRAGLDFVTKRKLFPVPGIEPFTCNLQSVPVLSYVIPMCITETEYTEPVNVAWQ